MAIAAPLLRANVGAGRLLSCQTHGMPKPWEQSWQTRRVGHAGVAIVADGSDLIDYVPAPEGTLAATAPELARALLKLEWGVQYPADQDGPTDLDRHCEACGGRVWEDGQEPRHDRRCFVDAALKAAGLHDFASREAARAAIGGPVYRPVR